MHDLPPPYTALTRHPMLPRPSHDEAARFNFLTHLNRYLSGVLGPGNRLAYDRQVLPAFRAEHGRDPEHRYEIRDAMNQNSLHRTWSALKRNSMEMRQHNGRQTVLRQLDELDALARQFNEHLGQLELDPAIAQPEYQTAVDIHCQPGGYHSEERPCDDQPDDVANPIRIDGQRLPNRAAPLLGADTDDILAELGLDAAEVADLKRAGVV